MKKKFFRAKEVPYVTKALSNAIMERSELESNFLKYRNQQNMNNFREQKKFCNKLYKRERKRFYSKIN